MEKMNIKEQAKVRAQLYNEIGTVMVDKFGYETEPYKEGLLVHMTDGNWVKVRVSIADPEKFDIEATRTEYAAQLAARAERARVAQEKAAEKARKAAEKAAKAAEKVTN